jgi:hypothetical protein
VAGALISVSDCGMLLSDIVSEMTRGRGAVEPSDVSREEGG